MQATLSIPTNHNGTPVHISPARKGRKMSDAEQSRRAEQRAATKAAVARAATEATREAQVRKLCLGLSLACLLPVVALMGVSLPHLADESRRILHCSNAVAWLTAFTFDVSQLIAEVVLVFAGMLALPRKVTVRLWCVIGGCTIISWVLNTLAFCRDAETPESVWMGRTFGLLIPALILTLLYCSAYLAKRAKGHA
jgi:cation transport ATPase